MATRRAAACLGWAAFAGATHLAVRCCRTRRRALVRGRGRLHGQRRVCGRRVRVRRGVEGAHVCAARFAARAPRGAARFGRMQALRQRPTHPLLLKKSKSSPPHRNAIYILHPDASHFAIYTPHPLKQSA